MHSLQKNKWNKIIVHADMDAFFAAVEQLDNPHLRGKPIVIGGDSNRSVVSTASYEARVFGLKSAMSMVEAKRRCPDVIIVPVNMQRYAEVSKTIMSVFKNFSPLVEPISIDEAFIDMTGSQMLFGTPEEIAHLIKKNILKATGGLTISVGIAASKYVAKVASNYKKPNGTTIVNPGCEKDFLWPLSISQIWGVGPKTKTKIEKLGIQTIGDVAKYSQTSLEKKLGNLGHNIWNMANAIDPRKVISVKRIKSISQERTLAQDIVKKNEIWSLMQKLAQQVAVRLRKKHFLAKGVRIKLKTSKFKTISKQSFVDPPADSAKELLTVANKLLSGLSFNEPIRLVGLTAFNFIDAPVQQELFIDKVREKNRRLDRTIDEVIKKFGNNAVKLGED